ncbi:hypothetical protein [Candidatus Magnetobacterium casense]|uniref:Uncharacterized protein n=1 Tax=Candidatus Magnetobacterium casense TaxID=1455061 RepID=A0ABS6S368_9BACT|nr:hypothetical protein [Candidatus Magnetobacterium casensis]MBV6342819.1 hypothetical protein [Candidatus Magnetobacterium casensis]
MTRSETLLGASIRALEAYWAPDGYAEYNHAGFFFCTCHDGAVACSIEALPEGIFGRRWPDEFMGEQILIARHEAMDEFRFWQGFGRVEMEIGEKYPFHRLLLHALGPLAEINIMDMNVCSEIVQMFCFFSGLTRDRRGWNPDSCHEWLKQNRRIDYVFEGVP